MIKKIKTNLKEIIFVSILLMFTTTFLLAKETDATTANQFLKMDVGARTLAMGGAFVAVADDVNSIRYNPAGLRQIEKTEISATHMLWIADLNVEQLSFATKMPRGKDRYLDVFGASIFYMGSGTPIEGRDKQGYVTDPDLNYNNIALTLSGAKSLDLYDNVLFGANLKYAEENYSDTKYSSLLLDTGILYKWKENMNLGFSVRNIGPDSKGDKMPLEMRAGTAYQKDKLGLSLDFYKFIDTDLRFALGGEYFIKNIFVVRAGYNYSISDNGKLLDFESWADVSEYSVSGLSLGFGFLTKPIDFFKGYEFKLDYALVDFGRLGFTHIFTISTEI